MATSKGRNADPAAALRDCRAAFIGVGVASALVNLLYLTGSFFMLEVYDRILPSRSIPSLIALSLLALLLYAFQGAFELIRGRMLVRIAGALDESLNGRIYRAMVKAPLKLRMQETASRRCATSIRSGRSCRVSARRRSSTCPGYLSTSRFVFSFTRSSD